MPTTSYMAAQKPRSGKAADNEGDCRPAHYRTMPNGVQMLAGWYEWLAVPDEAIQYRYLRGATRVAVNTWRSLVPTVVSWLTP